MHYTFFSLIYNIIIFYIFICSDKEIDAFNEFCSLRSCLVRSEGSFPLFSLLMEKADLNN